MNPQLSRRGQEDTRLFQVRPDMAGHAERRHGPSNDNRLVCRQRLKPTQLAMSGGNLGGKVKLVILAEDDHRHRLTLLAAVKLEQQRCGEHQAKERQQEREYGIKALPGVELKIGKQTVQAGVGPPPSRAQQHGWNAEGHLHGDR